MRTSEDKRRKIKMAEENNKIQDIVKRMRTNRILFWSKKNEGTLVNYYLELKDYVDKHEVPNYYIQELKSSRYSFDKMLGIAEALKKGDFSEKSNDENDAANPDIEAEDNFNLDKLVEKKISEEIESIIKTKHIIDNENEIIKSVRNNLKNDIYTKLPETISNSIRAKYNELLQISSTTPLADMPSKQNIASQPESGDDKQKNDSKNNS